MKSVVHKVGKSVISLLINQIIELNFPLLSKRDCKPKTIAFAPCYEYY